MPRQRLWLVAGLAAFLLGLVILFPARVAWSWVAPPGVALAGIEGSVWQGSAREASGYGLYLRELRWRMKPLALFTGRLAFHVQAAPGGGAVEADVALAAGGRVQVTGLAGTVPLPLLESVIGVPGLGGYARADIAALDLADGLPVRADGTVAVSSLVLPFLSPGSLGAYHAELQTRDAAIVAAVRDDGAVVDLAGQLTLGGDRDYEFLGYVAPTDATPPGLAQQLQYLGSPNDRGQYELRLSGRL